MDTNQYLEMFIDESKEHLQAINENLLALENDPNDMNIVNEVFRSAHTLKGMSATMGYEDLANLTHKMENVLDGIRNHKISVNSDILDVVFSSVDDLEAMVNDIASGGDGKRDVSEVVQKLLLIEKGEDPKSGTVKIATEAKKEVGNTGNDRMGILDEFEITVLEQSKEQGFDSYHITVKLRDDCLLRGARVFMVFEILEQIGEVIKANPSVEDLEEERFDYEFSVVLVTKENAEDIEKRIMKVSEIENVIVNVFSIEEYKQDQNSKNENNLIVEENASSSAAQETNSKGESGKEKIKGQNVSNKTIRVNIERLDILMNLFEELVIDRGRLEQISNDLNNAELHETVERMSRISGDLQNIILNMRMVPVEQVFNRFPRMVRQLARDLNKKINLEIIGAETELDRTVIDEIGDPLVHLIRNALDHGIETPEERIAKGKPEEGTVVLKAYHSGNHVFIEIEDDGAGINRDKVLKKAIERGVVTAEAGANMTDKQVYELILASGFSTADKISDVSGRGVGLDVVKSTIESLSGSVSIESRFGHGSIFSIQLPLTLSIISVMLIEIQEEKYAIPLSSIIETAIIKKQDILNAHNQKVIDFRGKVVPLVFLKEIFEVPVVNEEDGLYSVVIVRKGEKMAGLVVDSFIGQQEIVLKSLGNYLNSAFAISGATILGNGQVALIIDCNALIK
ncbi:chemotaxis protein histidine kinase-like protein [Schinkia azotoformans MEV2011]|uniref:Chemotaxis protein CheA n=1 Tax=Schinkia azotoformans MEV2011 TaxID=1348973 RepID=A0A072NSN1_SCHAZ|nr:chemotaxis protein CheA [Schinkia azotoformans]KEF39898.1 chemotaxis protein histidine kinase-like protein [Schinkia azotoformans MEV2011]MEC1697197.1 chemotaxis protein CheA [Schinkia azotoformans]MEC1724236.1 chemotaxis protein CheA [Schinkia azotoformans]MEC1771440.1 chemotaxis protein CheA [Schinkia azotoformans]MEC1778904.1 chemotaxis protein CheA [Schinkia azotoformans]